MKATIFHKTFEFNVPQDVASKYLKACEILDKKEEAYKKSELNFDITPEEIFPLIALSAVVEQASSNIDNVHECDDTHTIAIKLPSFNNFSTMLNVRMKANSSIEPLIRNAAAEISLNCDMFKASYKQEDADLYRMAVLKVLTEQL